MQRAKKKGRSRQPSTPVIERTQSPTDEDVGKDFGILINAPLSKGGHFVFKSEKDWTVDSSQYAEFFTLNLKTLSAAIDCIPFNKYVDVADKYFVSDQLTSIYNDTERGKAAYSVILDKLNASSLSETKSGTEENTRIDLPKNMIPAINVKPEKSNNDLEIDLDFLLSLEKPVQNTAIEITPPVLLPTSHNSDSKMKSKSVPTKSFDLEKWLDSILDD